MYENCVIWHVRRHARNGARAPFYTVERAHHGDIATLGAVIMPADLNGHKSIDIAVNGVRFASAHEANRAMIAARAAMRAASCKTARIRWPWNLEAMTTLASDLQARAISPSPVVLLVDGHLVQ